MSNWRAGMKAVSLKSAWTGSISGRRYSGPSKDEIVTVARVVQAVGMAIGQQALVLVEYPDPYGYAARAFRPAKPDLTAELARTWKESVPSEQEVENPIPQVS